MRPIPFVPVLMAAIGTVAVAYISRQMCFDMGSGAVWYCYSDYGPVYAARELAGGRFPYGLPALEYPAGLGLILWVASAVGGSAVGFARISMALSATAALAIAWMLWRLTNRRALLFAAAPTLALYAFLNWDLIALACAVAAIAAFALRRDGASGFWLGLGTAIKIFPILLLLPMIVQRLREGDVRRAMRLAIGAALPIALVNVPVAVGLLGRLGLLSSIQLGSGSSTGARSGAPDVRRLGRACAATSHSSIPCHWRCSR
jgi:hypothetical protein